MSMKIKFWGVRGSIPCPGAQTMKYGGNTACIELRFPEINRLIIIDAGSGIRELGNFIMANDFRRGPINTDIFLTHTHWDHIMGFPFFTPIYVPGSVIRIHGPVSFEGDTLAKIVGDQLTYRYFPVRQEELAARIDYFDLKEGALDLGDGITVTAKYLNHPILCLGYRFAWQGKTICTAYDTEPFRNVFCTDLADPSYDEGMATEGQLVAEEQNAVLEHFFAGADLLVHDAQYTQEEYQARFIGWGHSSFEHTVAAARRTGVKSLALFHHDPMRTDAQIDALTEKYCVSVGQEDPEVFFAREGLERAI
ncbi:MAG TPA: MBL fold metallo-hydrolase [Desulfobulbaceae bacterium]|nr:MAG: MBL fold metallo-hydrolase [Deltaproteobacteria bacterium RIFOXYD12_FULL_53_23]HCC54871.1 MBL fold metallo-hydrolase [Desulfobulbaceae bacterium]